MTEEWAQVWRIGITITALLVMVPMLLAYLRVVKRYWLGEMNRETERKRRDNNGK